MSWRADPTKVVECTFSDVRRWERAALRDEAWIRDTKNTRWFRYEDCGCIGVFYAGKGVARLKGWFVDPAYRGAGVGDVLMQHAIHLLVLDPQVVQVHRMPMQEVGQKGLALYGFRIVGQSRFSPRGKMAHLDITEEMRAWVRGGGTIRGYVHSRRSVTDAADVQRV